MIKLVYVKSRTIENCLISSKLIYLGIYYYFIFEALTDL